jgi:ABC-2 type transport system permease protein
MTAITLVSIVLAIYVTGVSQVKGHVVWVSETAAAPASSKMLSIVAEKQEPPYSALVRQQYDAYVIDKGNGDYSIITLRNGQFKAMLTELLKNPDAPIPTDKSDRGVGVNIFGFMLMFLLMGVFMNLFTFADDKEKGQLSRIAISPVSFSGYLAAQFIYCLSMFLPSYLMIALMKAIGFNIGFSLLQYALLLFVLALLGISFCLLLNTLLKKPDNASMLGNVILVLSSILSGSFYSFSKDNRILDDIVKILPQKQLLDFAQELQNGGVLSNLMPLCYVVAFSLVLFTLAYVILVKQFVKRI